MKPAAPSADAMSAVEAACPLCSGPARYAYSGRDLMFDLYRRYDYLCCADCGAAFQHPMPDPQAIAAFYPPDYGVYDEKERTRSIGAWRRALLRRCRGYRHLPVPPPLRLLAAAMAPFVEPPGTPLFVPGGRMLDVGCGNGRYLRTMRSLGWQVEGVELNRQSAEFCRSTQLSVHNGDLASAQFPSASFDVITARHVIEHIPAPHQFMAELARLLKPGGCLVVETPNFGSLGWALFGTKWYATGIPYHLMLFSPGNLALLAGRHGLVPVRQELETSQKLFLNSLDILFERKGRPSRKIKWRRFLARLFVRVAQRQGRGDVIHSTFRRPL